MKNHESKATVKNIRLNKDEADRARKSAVGEKLRAREKFIVKAEASATAFEASYAKLKAMNEQHTVLYRSFKEIAAVAREELLTVRHFFAHKNDGELLFGLYAVGEEWSQARCGVGYDYVCRLTPPTEQKLLKDVNETAQSSVSAKPRRKAADGLQDLLAALPTDAARVKFMKKFDAQVADLKAKNEKDAEVRLTNQKAVYEQERKDAEKETARLHKLAVEQAKKDGEETERRLAKEAAAKLPRPVTNTADEANALKLADIFARNIAMSLNKSGTVADAKLLASARKTAIAYCKLRGISFVADLVPPRSKPTNPAKPTLTEEEKARAAASDSALKNEPSQAKPAEALNFVPEWVNDNRAHVQREQQRHRTGV